MGTLIAGETLHECHEWRQDVYVKSLYLLSNFAVDLTFSKKLSFFKNKERKKREKKMSTLIKIRGKESNITR